MVVFVFLLGWMSTSRFTVPTTWLTWADRYVINVALPAVILAKVSRVELSAQAGIPVIVAWLSMSLCIAMVLVLGRLFSWPRARIGALLLVGVLGNTSFLGIEVVRTLLGDGHVAAAVTYDQLGTFLALALYGSWVAGRFGSGESGWRPVVRRVTRFVPFLALILSVATRGIDIPSGVMSVLDGIGLSVAPVAMGVLGIRFSLRWSAQIKWAVVAALVAKMIVVPAFLLVAAAIIGDIHSVEWSASLLQSAAPPMVTAGVVAIAAGFEEELIVATVGVGTLVSFVSLPLFSLIL